MRFLHVLTVTLVKLCYTADMTEGSRILILMPFPMKSQFMTFSVLAEELAKRGHNITMVTATSIQKTIPDYREIFIEKDTFGNIFQGYSFSDWTDLSAFHTMTIRWKLFPIWVEQILASKPIQALINSHDEYDVIIGQFFLHQEAFLAFGHRFNAPLIELCPQISPLSTVAMMGNPQSLSYSANHELPYNGRMDFVERLHNTIFSIFKLVGIYWYELPRMEKIVETNLRYPGMEARPPLTDMIKNISLVLVNSHVSFHPSRPYAPNMVEIGGFHVRSPEKLPADLQSFMDEATEGVILVSFGTNIRAGMISKEREEAFISVFAAVKQRVLWRWDNKDACGDTSKVLIREWIPQQSVLAHSNCVLYLTHGGIASLIEAIHFGVPVIGFPFMLDQFHNVEFIQTSGIGLKFDIYQVTHDKLFRAVTTVLSTPSYRDRVKEQSRIMRDQPLSPLDRAIFWVEYVIRHKGAHHLKPASIQIPFYQYLLIDVILVLLVALASVFFIFWKLILFFHRKSICRDQKFDRKTREKAH